jgi:Protein of unknown function (DUF2585)
MRLDGAVPPAIVAGTTLILIGWRKFHLRGRKDSSPSLDLTLICLVIAVAGFLEWRMGRPVKYRHGPVRIWSGNINSDQNSQQIADPYTFTHFVHGAAFYGVTRLALGSASVGLRAIVAMALESSWEAYENTDTVVERYRAATISLGYYGDSLINSVVDIIACGFGFLLAWRLPRAATFGWVIAVEIMLAFWIRDNLTLNVIMLVHPFAAIRRWQMGA